MTALYGFTAMERNRLACESKMCCLWRKGSSGLASFMPRLSQPKRESLTVDPRRVLEDPENLLHHCTQCNPPFQSTRVSRRLECRVSDCLIISSLRSEAAIPDCLTGKRNITPHKPSIPPLVLDPSCKTRFVALQYT